MLINLCSCINDNIFGRKQVMASLNKFTSPWRKITETWQSAEANPPFFSARNWNELERNVPVFWSTHTFYIPPTLYMKNPHFICTLIEQPTLYMHICTTHTFYVQLTLYRHNPHFICSTYYEQPTVHHLLLILPFCFCDRLSCVW